MEINATILVQIFLVVALLLWLSPSLFAPIMRLFDERERRIFGAKEESALMNREALEMSQVFDKKLEEARINARHLLTELKAEADSEQAQALAQVRAQAKAKLEQAEKELLHEENRVRAELLLAKDEMAEEIVKSLMAKPRPKMESHSEALRV